MAYLCGVDIGGTFTDCVLVGDDGTMYVGKASTTPDDPSQGFLDSIRSAAANAGVDPDSVLTETTRLLHGTTIATNAVVQRNGAKVGLITTKGHGDAILMMRGAGRTTGMPIDRMLDIPGSGKPQPLVPRTLIHEVTERVDFDGEVVVSLDEEEARSAVRDLVAQDVDAICVSFLWSTANNTHEELAASIIEREYPDLFLSVGNRVIRRWGEYERTVGAVINAYVGPVTKSYLERLGRRLRDRSYERPFLVMQATGGFAPSDQCAREPLSTISSGPVGGLEGTRFLAERLGVENVIATDMGGTSFDVGLVVDGQPVRTPHNVIGQYEYSLPVVDVQSIGSGGGSVAWVEDATGALHVGPESAGSQPGPACYGRGGTRPTVTDCALVLGYLNPGYFLGGELALERDAAVAAVSSVGDRLGLGTLETAAGVCRIVEHQMADLIRKMTVQRGYDPRDFTLFAYGGAGAVHACVFGKELGLNRVIVPLGDVAGAWSAMGVASSNAVRVAEMSFIAYEPFDARAIGAAFAELETQITDALLAQGFGVGGIELRRFAAMQYGYQVHQVEVPVTAGALETPGAEQLAADFETKYEQLFGRGAGYRDAGIQIVGIKVEGTGRTAKPALRTRRSTAVLVEPVGSRDIYWPELKQTVSTPVYRPDALVPGTVFTGPTVLEMHFTTVVIHEQQRASVDDFGNIVIEV
jgi:N-methylhydantoinase A